MNKKCVFTIVAKNYIGLALILEKSIKRFDSGVDFYIFVADEFLELEGGNVLPNNVLIAKEVLGIEHSQWTDMTFKYDLTEFCTSIKPTCFKFLLNKKGYENIIYFDPDICVFSSIRPIFILLEQYSFVLTPQITFAHINYVGELPEWNMFANGMFNLGFLGISNSSSSIKMLDWWEERLKDKCFMDRVYVYFTDQIWMNFLPCFFESDSVHVSRNLGLNLAPWNYFEREVVIKDNAFFVKNRMSKSDENLDKLVFYHAAGYDYNALVKGIVKRKRITSLQDYNDIDPVLDEYRNIMLANKEVFDHYSKLTYTYNTYNNGVRIDRFHRRLYHGLVETKSNVINPFAVGSGSLYSCFYNSDMIKPDQNIDLYTKENIQNLDQKKRLISFFFKILFHLLGYKRYVLFVRSLLYYSRMEEHIFLIEKKK